MRLGIFAKTFVRPTVEAVFDAVASHGLRCVQFNMACAGGEPMPATIDAAIAHRIRAAAASRNIEIAAVSGTFNMIHPDVTQRREGLQRLHTLAAACTAIGTRIITLCTGTRDPQSMWRAHPGNDAPDAWDDLLESMREAIAIADEHDLTLGIEPELSNVVDSAIKARQLLDTLGSPRVKIIIDPANLFPRGSLPRMKEILTEAFGLLGRDIVLAHAKDIAEDGEAGDRAAGTGLLDYDLYLSLLRRHRFDGPLILHGLAEAEVPAAGSFVRSKLATG